jgi:hypothetical protein
VKSIGYALWKVDLCDRWFLHVEGIDDNQFGRPTAPVVDADQQPSVALIG